MVTVHFYTRQGCHLCETAEQALREFQRRQPFELAVHDIDTAAEWLDLYNLLVPVTVLPNGDEMHYRVDAARLQAAFPATS